MVDAKRIFVFVLLGVFLISFMAGIVGAAEVEEDVLSDSDVGVKQVAGDIWGGLKEISFINSTSEVAGIISKLLLMILVILLVYSVADSFGPLSGADKSGLRWGVSAIIGVLSFMFVSIENIRAILGAYEALGVTMTTVIPFAILVFFAYKMGEQKPAFSRVIMVPIFILFGVYLLFRWMYLPNTTPLKWIYLLTLVFVVLWIIFWKPIQKAIDKAKNKDINTRAVGTVRNAVSGAKDLESAHKGLGAPDVSEL